MISQSTVPIETAYLDHEQPRDEAIEEIQSLDELNDEIGTPQMQNIIPVTYSLDNYDSVLNRSQDAYNSDQFDDQCIYSVDVQS